MKKILVIEDNAENRLLFLDILEAEGFCTISAEDGLIGINQAREHLPDIIICEMMMPRIDGYTVLTTLRQDLPTAIIPFICLATKATQTDLRKGMTLGADDYLTQPCKLEDLLSAISAQLKKQAAQKQWYAIECQRVPEQPQKEVVSLPASQSFFPTYPKLKKVFDFIEANYHMAVTLNDVAKAVGYSPAYLTDLVKRQTGETVQRWIIKRRMAAACSMLLNTNDSVNKIAEAVGYNDKNYFFYQFRQYYEMTPQMWRKQKLNIF